MFTFSLVFAAMGWGSELRQLRQLRKLNQRGQICQLNQLAAKYPLNHSRGLQYGETFREYLMTYDKQTQTEIEAATFRRLLKHLDDNKDVQNIDLMILANFCRNCLGKWYATAAKERGVELTSDQAGRWFMACLTHSGKRGIRLKRLRSSSQLWKRARLNSENPSSCVSTP